MKRRNISAGDAMDLVRDLDVRKQDYLRFYFDADPDQPTLYHMVLNTSRVSFSRCVDLVQQIVADVAAKEGAED